MTLNLQQHAIDRAGAVADAATQAEYAAIMAALEGHPNIGELEHLVITLAATSAEAAWIDGWQCGRDPGRLVFLQDGAE